MTQAMSPSVYGRASICSAFRLRKQHRVHSRPWAVRTRQPSETQRPSRAITNFAPVIGADEGAPPSSDAAPVLELKRLPDFQSKRALVLDSSYRPIEVVSWQRAICLDLFDKVDVLEYYDTYVRSARTQFLIPAVLRVRVYVAARGSAAWKLTLSRRNILIRDANTCQYCGERRNLTVDHVVPVSKGGTWSWDNLVSACSPCNSRKGNKTLKQMGWTLRKPPREPSSYEFGVLIGMETELRAAPKEWGDYLGPFTLAQEALA